MFDDFHRTVMSFMRDFGFTATYLKRTSVYDVATSENVVTESAVAIQAIQLEMPLKSDGITTNTGTLIKAGDKQLFIRPTDQVKYSATPLVIDPSTDKVKIGGIIYKIVSYKEINPTASNQILIELYIRR